MAHLKKDIMEALKKSDEKMECYSRKTEEKMNDFSKKADDLLERFTIITNTVGTQIQGMNSSIVKLHETNEKMKEEGENKFNKIDERLMDMEKKKRIGYVKSCINKKYGVPLYSISLNWITKHVSVKGQIVVKTCQDGSFKFSKYQDVEDEVDELMQKWQTKNSSQRLGAVTRRG